MGDWYECFKCHKVLPLSGAAEKCPSCGSTNGQKVSAERVKEALKAGAHFNFDPKTGGRAKKRK